MTHGHINLSQEAKALPIEERKRILAAIAETDLHHYLAALFRAMSPEYWVEVTHGSKELGKDLVILRQDPLSPDVIAVVVKRGDIKAKTAGDIDEVSKQVSDILTAKGERVSEEILSQVRQARVHEAELKTTFRRLTVTKVIVLLVGEISSNVRVRFEKEVGRDATVKDVVWLVDSFTHYYPQVFFDGRATDFLDDLVRALEQDGFYAKTGRTLSECFVEPLIEPDRQITVDKTSLAVRLKQKRIPFADLPSLVARNGRVLLVGDPGSGKSKAVAKLCIDAYRAALSTIARSDNKSTLTPIPILLSARKLDSADSNEQVLAGVLPETLRERFRVSTLIVDGLDEVPTASREIVLGRATTLASSLGASLLLTARNLASFSVPPEGFQRLEILPFQLGQALKLVQRVLTSPEVLPALKDGIQRIRAQLPMSPLSLLLLIELAAERKEVPSSITELYDRFLDLVFGRWDRDKGVTVLFEYVVKKRFLASLAYYEFFLERRLEITAKEFDSFTRSYASEYGWDDGKLKDFVKEIERAGILSLQEEVFFKHRSFLDYFVALHMHERRDVMPDLTDKVVEIYFDGIWTDVAFFFAGIGREVAQELLERIFGYNGDDRPIEKLMAGRLLQAGWHSPTKVKEFGVRQAIRFVPASAQSARELFERAKPKSATHLMGDLFAIFFADNSLGSGFLAQERSELLEEFSKPGRSDAEQLLRRIALLSAHRHSLSEDEYRQHMERFIGGVLDARLESAVEARFLVITAVSSDQSEVVRNSVTRRLKMIARASPGTLKAVFPDLRLPYRPPPKRA